MTKSDLVNLPVESSNELVEQKFQQMDLKELGLQSADFQEVLAARKELQNM
ncbi:toxic anion resistance protein, partial [Yersinia pestis]